MRWTVSYYPSGRPKKLSWFKATKLYWEDHKFKVMAALGLSAYVPVAVGDDAAAPFTLGLTLLDDFEIPLAGIVAISVILGINKYRTPPQVQHVMHHQAPPRNQQRPVVIQGDIVEYPRKQRRD